MKKRILRFLGILIALSVAGAASAQSLLDKVDPAYTIQVTTNAPGASLSVDFVSQGKIPTTIKLTKGNHLFEISAPGYETLKETRFISKAEMISFQLVPLTANLTVSTNVNESQIFINGKYVGNGKATMQAVPGNYNIKVSAAGYQEYNSTVNMGYKDMVVPVNLVSATANLTITTDVGNSQIFVNGKFIGNGQATLQVTPGNYIIKATAPGFKEYNTIVKMGNQDMVVPVKFENLSAILNITTDVANSQIYVNGKFIGNGQVSMQAAPGNYIIKATAPGYAEYNTMINMGDKPMTVPISFMPLSATLTITVNVKEAQIQVNGKFMGNGDVSMSAPAGDYKIRVTAAGYEDYETFIKMKNQNMNVPVTLIQAMKALLITAEPKHASIFVDGNYVGNGNATVNVSPGNHQVKATAPGYQDYYANVQVTANNQQHKIVMSMGNAMIKFYLPSNLLNPRVKDHKKYFMIYVDGQEQKKADMSSEMTIEPGNHVIEITSGALSFSSNYFFKGGETYMITIGTGSSPLMITEQ